MKEIDVQKILDSVLAEAELRREFLLELLREQNHFIKSLKRKVK